MTMSLLNARRRTRGSLSAATGAVLLTVGLAIPALDRLDLSTGPGVEGEHHAATCRPAHDHTVCTQIGGGLWAPAMAPQQARSQIVERYALPVDGGAAHSRTLERGHPTRAPPLT